MHTFNTAFLPSLAKARSSCLSVEWVDTTPSSTLPFFECGEAMIARSKEPQGENRTTGMVSGKKRRATTTKPNST
jgi:hypothetical protein